jgi:hypothetical protein
VTFPKLPKITLHDVETGGVAFGAGFLASLSQSASFTTAALVAALSAGLTAVAHKFLKTPPEA